MQSKPTDAPGIVARTALGLTAWSERWIPDAFVFALWAGGWQAAKSPAQV
jgi:hypothetical protein